MRGELQVLVGMIASGKSTYARTLASRGAVIVNDDAIVSAIHGGEYGLYDYNLKGLYKTTEQHIACSALLLGRKVIVDRGVNVRREARARWVSIANSLDVPCTAIVFPKEIPSVHAFRRTHSDNRGYAYPYWLRVAQSHEKDWSDPVLSEGFREIIYVGSGTQGQGQPG